MARYRSAPAVAATHRTVVGPCLRKRPSRSALGGIRRPPVEEPLATHRGESPNGQIDLLDSSIPFTLDELRRLYADRADYETRCVGAPEALVATGVILSDDAEAVLAQARNAWPWPVSTVVTPSCPESVTACRSCG
jgi:hypothetical protein